MVARLVRPIGRTNGSRSREGSLELAERSGGPEEEPGNAKERHQRSPAVRTTDVLHNLAHLLARTGSQRRRDLRRDASLDLRRIHHETQHHEDQEEEGREGEDGVVGERRRHAGAVVLSELLDGPLEEAPQAAVSSEP